MKVKLLGTRGSWRDVADSARTTINKEAGEKNHLLIGREECYYVNILL